MPATRRPPARKTPKKGSEKTSEKAPKRAPKKRRAAPAREAAEAPEEAPPARGRKAAKPSPPRRRPRKAAEETRGEILDAAQRRLSDGGPEAVRLQDVARDVGISHPAILHHFGSREGLMEALEARVTGALTEEVGRVLIGGTTAPDGAPGDALVDSVARAMDEGGLARLVAWWVLRDPGARHEDARRIVARVVELIRVRMAEESAEGAAEAAAGAGAAADAGAREGRGAAPPGLPSRETIAFSVRLAVLATFGDALIGHSLGLAPPDQREAESRRFRTWLGDLLVEHLAKPPEGS